MICMTLDCVRPTQFSVIQNIHCNVSLKFFFNNFIKMFVIIVIYAYFINISQSSVETHLWCGGICNNHVIVNCLQNVIVNRSIIGKDMNKSKVLRFFGPPCTCT